ncbi:MAG: hypothetical protein QG626_426 [Patescibacteria group bacterium]|nr:hypothetical protein [Patescibacteria group bacterium]
MVMATKIILLILAIIVLIIAIDIMQTQRLIAIGIQQTQKATAFQRRLADPEYAILVIGDSSAVGVGALPPDESIAGRLAKDFPTADVENLAVSGSKVQDALMQLSNLPPNARYDLILIQIGGNDIVRRTPLSDLQRDIPKLLSRAQQHSSNVVQLTSGNVGTSKLLPFGTRWYFTLRTKQVRKIFMAANIAANTHYVDLLRKHSEDPYAKDPQTYYSPDFFHPSAAGYGDWYAFVQPVVTQILSK